ncbi:MAG: hypothetical protein P4M14_03655 [Gammaproteobacteria bacterium]|nr:hypothetical protein [Gammaproteobacteria bacterium]
MASNADSLDHSQLKPFSGFWVWLFLSCLLGLEILLQSQSLIGIDMSWLLHATRRFLDGGNYWSDFFEINPPMVLYINVAPVLLAGFLKISTINAFRIYVFSLALISFCVCRRLLSQMISPRDSWIYFLLLTAIFIDMIVLPGYHFGQREHIATLLVLPYFLLAVMRTSQSIIKTHDAIGVGMMAGVGFMIKPHFLFAFLLVELYVWFRAKSFWSLFRYESVLVGLVAVFYVFSVFWLTPEYFKLIPYIRDFFSLFLFSSRSWAVMLTEEKMIYFLLAAMLFFLMRKTILYRDVAVILLLAALGFFLSYIVEPLYLPYHTIPMFAFSILLVTLLFAGFVMRQLSPQKVIKKRFWKVWVWSFWLMMIAGFPAYAIYQDHAVMVLQKQSVRENQLIQFMKSVANGKKITVFSTDAQNTYPLVDYAGAESISRFETFWVLPYMANLSLLHTSSAENLRHQQENFFIKAVTEDMEKGQPAYVFMDAIVGWGLFDDIPFDYIKFFEQSAQFREIWKKYRYVTQIDDMKIYKRIE